MMAPSPIRVSWPTWQVDMSRQLAPISVKPSGFVARWMVTYSLITVPAPPPQHRRELGLGDPDPEELGQRASIGAAELEAGRDVGDDTRLRAQHGAISDADMIADSDLSAQDHASPDFARARDPGLCRDDGILTDLHVVGHHDEIIDLHAASHDGRSQRAAVDRRVGADLDVVLDDHAADLGNLPMGRAVPGESEPVGAQHGAGVNDHPAAHTNAVADDDMGV